MQPFHFPQPFVQPQPWFGNWPAYLQPQRLDAPELVQFEFDNGVVNLTNITMERPGIWTFTWNATNAAFYRVVLNGTQLYIVQKTDFPSYVYTLPNPVYTDFPPPLEIMEENTQAPSEINKPYLVMQWYGLGTSEASYYSVQQQNGSIWTEVKKVYETGCFMNSVQTPLLTDETQYNFRVIAYNSIGLQSPPVSFNILIVSPPSLKELDYALTYENGNLIVSEI